VATMRALVLVALFVGVLSAPCQNVKVDFYSESYWPGCESYSTNQIQSSLTTIGDIIDFRAFPYGNAKEVQNPDKTWSFTCQHGVNECIGNMYEGCAIEHYNTVDAKHIPTWWPFYYCMEKSGNAAETTVASGCAKNNGLDWTVITTCSTTTNPAKGSDTDGNPYMHNLAVATDSLVPAHQWTPWVVVDSSPLTSAQINLPLTPIVCSEYTKKNSGNSSCTAPVGCGKVIDLDYV